MTQKFIISSDGCCDLRPSYLKQNNVNFISIPYILEGKEYRPKFDDDNQYLEFYAQLRAGKTPSTSQLNAEEMEIYFTELLTKNQGDLVHITLSSGLSGTYSEAVKAAESVEKKMPGRSIYVVDSLSAALGQGMLVNLAIKLRDEGKSAAQAAQILREATKNLQHWVYIEDLKHLRRGGRISATSAFFGTLLHLKPVLSVSNEGKLKVAHKAFGLNKAFKLIIESMQKYATDEDMTVYVAHADQKEVANKLIALIEEAFPKAKVFSDFLGPVVGAHTGGDSLAVFFFGKPRAL